MSANIPSNWSNLPQDMLVEIVNRLDKKDLYRLACVCTAWNQFLKSGRTEHSQQYLRKLQQKYIVQLVNTMESNAISPVIEKIKPLALTTIPKTAEKNLQLLQKFAQERINNIKHWDLRGLNIEEAQLILQTLPQNHYVASIDLRFLTVPANFSEDTTEQVDAFMLMICEKFPNLKRIYLPDPHIEQIEGAMKGYSVQFLFCSMGAYTKMIERCPHLQFNQIMIHSDKVTKSFLVNLQPHLKEVRVMYFDNLVYEHDTLDFIAHHCPQLVGLTLTFSDDSSEQVTQEEIKEMILISKHIKSLSLYGKYEVTDDFFQNLPENFSQIGYLTLNVEGYGSHAQQFFSRALQDIEELTLLNKEMNRHVMDHLEVERLMKLNPRCKITVLVNQEEAQLVQLHRPDANLLLERVANQPNLRLLKINI